MKNIQDGQKQNLTLDIRPQIFSPQLYNKNTDLADVQKGAIDHLRSLIKMANILNKQPLHYKNELGNIYGRWILKMVELMHALPDVQSNIAEQLPELSKFLKDLILRFPYVGGRNFYTEIRQHYQDVKEDNSKITRNIEELDDILKKVEAFYKAEANHDSTKGLARIKIDTNAPESETIMFEDTEKSQSLRNSLIDFQKNFQNISTREQRIFTLLLLVNAEFLRKELLLFFIENSQKKNQKNKNTIHINENKFFQLAEHIGDFHETINTENIIETIKQNITEILDAENVWEIRNMHPIEDFAETDFINIIKKITAKVRYVFHSGSKKEKKELSKFIHKLEKSEKISENELGNYLQEISEDGKRKDPKTEIIIKNTK